MRLIVHDLLEKQKKNIELLFGENDKIVHNDGTIRYCRGCFQCWVKDPVNCIINDEYSANSRYMQYMSEYIIITECYCGSYSPFVKNVLDRSISYMLPFFTVRDGEMHHKERYPNKFSLKVYAYGNAITKSEKKTMQMLVKANAINLNCDNYNVVFRGSIKEIIELLEEDII